jgi:hypothetical protein
MRNPLCLFVMLFSCSSLAYADRLLQLPDGQTCWQSENGNVWGCSGGAAAAPARQPSRAELEYQRPAPTTCIELEAELNRIEATMRRGYSAAEGNELRRKRDSYEEMMRDHCR